MMRQLLLDAAAKRAGVLSRAEALAIVPHHVIDKAVASGHLVLAFPRVLVLAHLRDDWATRCRAAIKSVGIGAMLSHTTALAWWNLLVRPEGLLHVTLNAPTRHPRSTDLLRVHRPRAIESLGAPRIVRGLPVINRELAIIQSWPLLGDELWREMTIVATRRRRTSAAKLIDYLAAQCRANGRAEMSALLALLAEGCQSHLELFGFTHVFSDPSMPLSKGQHSIAVGTQTFYADRAFVAEMVDVEMDGATYHFEPWQRERDMARDELLSGLGWLVLRFSGQRLRHDPAGVRAAIRDVLAVRRRQLGLAA